jgi:hypothetical protein
MKCQRIPMLLVALSLLVATHQCAAQYETVPNGPMSMNAGSVGIPSFLAFGPTSVTATSAVLNVTIAPGGFDATVYLQWGASTEYPSHATTPVVVPGTVESQVVSFPIAGLSPSTVYQCYLVATNALGGYIGFPSSFLFSFTTGPWVQTGPRRAYTAIASSADGTRLVAASAGYILVSTNAGAEWITPGLSISEVWQSVVSSADGARLVGVSGTLSPVPGESRKGSIWISSDSGSTWSNASAPADYWHSVASSADGTRLAAASSESGSIYTSTNSGSDWTLTSAPTNNWTSVACSADGTKLVAVASPGWIYISTNSGNTWTTTSAGSNQWQSVASSADGTRLAAACIELSSDPGQIYTSADAGATWAPTSVPRSYWNSLVSSADGTRLVAAGSGGIYLSTNGGVNWSQSSPESSAKLSLSADGNRAFAATGALGLLVLSSPPNPILNIRSTEDGFVISWDIPSMGFVLEENVDLEQMNWIEIPALPELNHVKLQHQVKVSSTKKLSLYRLRSR